jgi:translocation and assembly module TamB
MTGHALVTARSRSEALTAYTLTNLDLGGPAGRITGTVTALTDHRRGLGVEDMALELTDLNLDVPRPYLDTLPLHGTLTGRLQGAGFKDGLDVDADVAFVDSEVVGGATSTLTAAGHLVLGGPEGTLLDTLVVSAGDVDLRTVQHLAPAVELDGRMRLAGVLKGPWHNLTYEGDVTHKDGEHPESHATGSATLDTRSDTVRFATRMTVAPLVFDGIRPSYPGIPIKGAVSGPVAVEGTARRFHLNTNVQGDLGVLAVNGTIDRDSLHLGAESLAVRFAGLDLALLSGSGPHTSLTGRLAADGAFDSIAGPSGTLAVDLRRGTVDQLPVDTLHTALRAADGTISLDTIELGWPGGRLTGQGALPWRTQGGQRLHAQFGADSLEPFGAFLERFTGPAPDTGEAREPLGGRLTGEIDVLGSALEPRLLLWTRGENLHWHGVRSPALALGFGWNRTQKAEIGVAVQSDSVVVGKWVIKDLNGVVGGYQDSLHWWGKGSLDDLATVAGGGEWWRQGEAGILGLDSLAAVMPRRTWRLREPARISLGAGRFDLTPLRLMAADGSGSVDLMGSIPRTEPGELTVSALGVSLRDIYSLLELDTANVAGTVQLNLTLGGTASLPTLRGTASLADLSFGDFGAPFVQGIVDYADRRLDASLLMWKTGQTVLRVEAKLPIDLALKSVPRRQLAGPILVRAIADSTDLAVAEAFTRNLRRVRGTLRADVEVSGTWDEPRLGGQLAIQDASASVPALGVRYDRVNALAHLSGDSVAIDSLVARSGEGSSLRATGGLRLERLTRPVLDLSFRARRFRAIDTRRFLTLDASGSVRLTGPVFHAHLTGRITADAGNLHFADLLTKRIVDLENPGDSGLIDLELIRSERLGANFQSRFLDSLTIDTLQVQMGESFWLRSSEANIQLDGELTVNKVRDRYRYDGTLNAVRGNYALRIGGFVTRDFDVVRGTVRYFGTPDLNADLDIEATHTVIAAETSEEIPVIAKITGTMLQPKLELTTTPTPQRPALSQTELVSYLMFGRPTFSLQGNAAQGSQYAAVQAGVSYLTSAFSSELQRSLISDLGVPIDYLDIRPGASASAGIGGPSGSAQVAQVAAGWQIGRKWFVSLVADLCTNTQRFYPNAEFRMTRQVRLKSSVEPTYSCQAAQLNPALSTNKYQVGLDVLWEKEY